MTLLGVVALVLHGAIAATVALLLAGLLPWGRARLAGYQGPPVLQPLQDWRRLLRKRPVVAEGVSPLFTAAPAISLAATAVAALLVPSFTLGMATAPAADLLVIAGMLAMARAALVLAALDSGTAAAGLVGLGSLRLGALAEAPLLLAVLTVALLAGSTNLDAAIGALRDQGLPLRVSLPLTLGALAAIAVATDAEDGAASEFSGWHLAAVEAAVALRRLVWLSLIACLWLPGGPAQAGSGPLAWPLCLLTWLGKLLLLGVALVMAGRLLRRASHTATFPKLIGTALLLAVLGVLFLLVGPGFV
jgi:formate hydrogenlyase subunit 4